MSELDPKLPFVLHCSGCGARLTVAKPSLIGRRLPCPKCKAAIHVQPPGPMQPDTDEQSASPTDELAQQYGLDDLSLSSPTDLSASTSLPAASAPTGKAIGSGGGLGAAGSNNQVVMIAAAVGGGVLLLLLVGMAIMLFGGSDPEVAEKSEAEKQPAAVIPKPAPRPPARKPPRPPQRRTALSNKSKSPAADAPRSRQEIIQSVRDAIVQITIRDRFGRTLGSGSGVVIDKSGLIITNYHVVNGAATAFAHFNDGAQYEIAGMRAGDKFGDLAIVQLKDKPSQLKTLAVQLGDQLEQGEEVIAIGHPSGFTFSVTTGIVSAVRPTSELPQEFREFLKSKASHVWIQTNAAISGGNSGGPLLDAEGNLIGINTWVVPGKNLNFAVHVRHVIELQKKISPDVKALPGSDEADVAEQLEPKVRLVLEQYKEAIEQFATRLGRAKTEGELSSIIDADNPTAKYAQKLLNMAQQNKGTRLAMHALMAACLVARDGTALSDAAVQRAAKQLFEDHIDDKELNVLPVILSVSTAENTPDLLQRLIDESPHREVKGVASFMLAVQLMDDEKQRRKNEVRIVKLLDSVVTQYSDVKMRDTELGEIAEEAIFQVKYLSIGKMAPEITGKDLAGQEMKLSDYRGKVVVLDFWVDWCPHCREMYPHERNLLEQYENKPFAIIGVNGDVKRRAMGVKQSGKVTWPSFSDGPDGPIAKRWRVSSYPTVYVLDAEGRIRFKGVRGAKLDAAIAQLLREAGGLLKIPENLVKAGATWKYHDSGERVKNWYKPEFDDKAWSGGEAPLGYGFGDEVTMVGPGAGKPSTVTTYFRHTFENTEPAPARDLILSLTYSGGIKVYLNGTEITRSNLKSRASISDYALDISPGMEKSTLLEVIDGKFLQQGNNVLAVEVHLESENAAELGFDLSLGSNAILKIGEKAQSSDRAMRRDVAATFGSLGTSGRAATPTLVKLHVRIAERVRLRALDARQYDSLLNAASAIVKFVPDNGSYLTTLGIAQFRSRDYQDAISTLRKAVARNGPNPIDFAYLAVVYQRLGQRVPAVKSYNMMVAIIQRPTWRRDARAILALREAQQAVAKPRRRR